METRRPGQQGRTRGRHPRVIRVQGGQRRGWKDKTQIKTTKIIKVNTAEQYFLISAIIQTILLQLLSLIMCKNMTVPG